VTELTNYTRLKSLTNISSIDMLTELENNLKCFLDWGLLGAGGWIDVSIPQTGIAGGSDHVLKYIQDPAYTNGQVWEGFRKDWVWETGVEFDDDDSNAEPTTITGVQVDGTMYGSGDATYGWHINYPQGRVIFDSAVATTSDVQLSFSYRWAQVNVVDSTPWWQSLQYGSMDSNELHFTQSTHRGEWNIGSHHRVQMPTILIETVPPGGGRAYELGNSSLIIEQDVLFHVFTESRVERNKIVDFLRNVQHQTIYLFNTDDIIAATGWPLDYRGMLVGSNMYPDLVAATGDGGYRWKKCRVDNVNISTMVLPHPQLYGGVVRWNLEIVRGNL